jgi:hypothetical protein
VDHRLRDFPPAFAAHGLQRHQTHLVLLEAISRPKESGSQS